MSPVSQLRPLRHTKSKEHLTTGLSTVLAAYTLGLLSALQKKV